MDVYLIHTSLPFLKKGIRVLLASLLLAASAQFSIPLYPVPFTLQTTAVLFLAFVLGKRMATMAVLAYLLEGACGLPVFAHFTGGTSSLLGPTGGYLWGFIFSAHVAGYLFERIRSRKISVLVSIALLGELPVFACGYIHLACFVGLQQAWRLGVVSFFASTAIKSTLLALCIHRKVV